ATRARASRRGEDRRLDALPLHVLGDLGAEAGHGLDVRHVPRRDVVVVVEPADDAVLLEPPRRVHGYGTVGIVVGPRGVAPAVPGLVAPALEVGEARDRVL